MYRRSHAIVNAIVQEEVLVTLFLFCHQVGRSKGVIVHVQASGRVLLVSRGGDVSKRAKNTVQDRFPILRAQS